MQIVEITHDSTLYHRAIALRDAVLRKPLGLKFTEADFAREVDCRHFGLLEEEVLVACLMAVPHGSSRVQFRQMAVLPELQGAGRGGRLMEAVEARLREEGRVEMIYLNARETAVGFYRRLGYVPVGEPFTEVGIPHQRMEKHLLV